VEFGGAILNTPGAGRWASERLLNAMKAGRPLSAAELRTCDTLRRDEWVFIDTEIIREGTLRLRAVGDLISAGLVTNIPNALGKTIGEYEKVSDMEPAIVSLDGLARGDSDRQEFSQTQYPIPITHKDFNIGIRTLASSRERGEPLNVTQAQTAGRLVGEKLETLLIDGGPTFGGLSIYGYRTEPNRNLGNFAAGVWSATARTGAEILTDVFAGVTALKADYFYGPYWLYIPSNTEEKFNEDYKAAVQGTIRERILQLSSISKIEVLDSLADDEVLLIQPTSDVVTWGMGESLQTVQWDLYGGFSIAFKAMAIQVPIVKSTKAGRSGVYHLTA